jgi:hypothetical protein
MINDNNHIRDEAINSTMAHQMTISTGTRALKVPRDKQYAICSRFSNKSA